MRRMLECGSCHRRFKIPQALFGHLRHCQWHRLKREAKAEAGNQPPAQRHTQWNTRKSGAEGTDTVANHQRRGRDSQENLLLLLDGSETFPKLKGKALDYGRIARMLGNVRPGMTTPEQWVDLYTTIDDAERDFEEMVLRLRLDRKILFRTYHQMLVVKRRWLDYLSIDFSANSESICAETHTNELSAWDEEAQMWDTFMTHIKKMLVASH